MDIGNLKSPYFISSEKKVSFSVLEILFILEQYFSCRFVARLSIPLHLHLHTFHLLSSIFPSTSTPAIPSTPFLRHSNPPLRLLFLHQLLLTLPPPSHRFKSFVSNTRAWVQLLRLLQSMLTRLLVAFSFSLVLFLWAVMGERMGFWGRLVGRGGR